MADDYYAVLGVSKDATSQEIKRAFREIARKCHPDVAGADAAAEEQFKSARKAYETLMDPVARGRYDRRGQRKAPPPGSFFDAFYRATGSRDEAPRPPPSGARPGPTGRKNPGNSVTLEDLFNDFGDFGFGEGKGGPTPASSGPRSSPQAGEDVSVDLDVPERVAREGGSLTAVYYRMQRADSWRPGAPDPGLVRVQDIADVRVMPGTADGETLRERGLGNAGAHGGPYGDLLVTVRIVRQPTAEPRAAGAETVAQGEGYVDLTIVEAMLGGRVGLDTPQGRVRLTIPPGTSSGVRLRLKGRGPVDAAGQPTDWFAVTRIVVPRELDAESRRLIEEFARLNPSADQGD